MQVFRKIVMLTLLMSAFAIGAAAQVTVANSTGANGDYTTLKAAFDAINANATQTGNNINITVNGSTTETATAELLAGNWTALTVRPTVAATVSGTIAGAVIKLNGADNVTIDGRIGGTGPNRSLTVANGSTATATAAIWLSSAGAGAGATNNIIRNLEIACGADQQTSTNITIGIIMNGATISTTANGDDNDNNSFIANRIIRARYGIVTRGVTTNLNIAPVVTDNIIGPNAFGADQIGKTGILMQADTGATVSRNTIQNVGVLTANAATGADRVGIGIGSESWSATDATTITSNSYTVTRNIINNIIEEKTFSAVGIKLGTTAGGGATNNLVANNFIINVRANGTSGDQFVGIGIGGGNGDRIVFNSISITGDVDPGAAAASTTYGNAIRIPGANGTNNANFTIQNNSIYLDVSSSSTAALRFYAITLNSAAYSFGTGGLNYNNYYINPANAQLRTGGLGVNTGNAITTEFATLANFQAALTTPQDANSIQANPNYASITSDLHIMSASPNINAGTSITGITDDIDGEVRPNGAGFDIGADEFYPAPGILQFSSISYGGSEGTTATITVTRTSGSSGTVTVDAALSNGTATGGAACDTGVDFINPGVQTLTFAENVVSQTINVQLCSDAVFDPSETVILTLSNPTGGAAIGANNPATLTIVDIAPPFTGAVSVGAGQNYTSLTNTGGLFEAINNSGATGNITVNITSDLTAETGTVSLNEITGGFTVTIQPSGGARIISGSNTTALINLNGADNVTIDGLNTNGNSLLIRNAGTAGATIRLINDASNNIIRNNTIEGSTNGNVIFIATGITTGNDNNRITANTVRDRTDAVGVPFNSVLSSGSASAALANSGTIITNNQITNFTQSGIIFLGASANENVTVTGNNVSSTANRATVQLGIYLASALGTNLISQNQIHDLRTSFAGGTGVSTGGILLLDVRDTTVSRNRIYNFAAVAAGTGRIVGIEFDGGSATPATANIVNNMISLSTSVATVQSVFGLFDFGFGGNTFTADFNSIYIGGTASGAAPSWAVVRGTAAPTTFTARDNIAYNNRTGGTGSHFAIGDQSANTGTFVSNYNFFAGTGATTAANFFDYGTSGTGTPVNFAAWQLGPPARDANSVAGVASSFDPANFFVDAAGGDLHLKATATQVLDAGTPIAGITTDFDGQTRSTTAPDIGADELVPLVPGTLALSSATYTVTENVAGGLATITVSRTGGTDGAVSAAYALTDGTATGGATCGGAVDYVNTGGTVSFANGETTKTFTVAICDDAVFEGSETFNVTISAPTGGATLGTPATAVVTITDNEVAQPGTVQFSSPTYSIGEAGGTATITVNRTGGTDGAVTVNYSLSNGTATGGVTCGTGVDFINNGGTVSFASGEASKTFVVTICNDTVFEGSETFSVTLAGATGGVMIGSTSSAVVTITDDETAQPGTVQFSATAYPVGENGTISITVTRTGGSDGSVTVDYATVAGGTATGGAACGTAGVDYVSTSGTLTFANGVTSQTFAVTICPDTTTEPNETINLALTNAAGGATLGTPATAVITITDDDVTTGPVTVSATAGTATGSYNNLTEAAAAINDGTHQGAIVVSINQTITEPGTVVLNGSGAGAAVYTSVLIRPTADNISDSGASLQGRGLIELNGADNVTIDGDNPNSTGTNRNLTLQNTAANTVTFTSVIRIAVAATIVTSADNNAFRNLNILGSATGRNIAAATTATGTENTTFGIFAGPGASTVSATTAPAAVTAVTASAAAGATAANLLVNNNSFGTTARAVTINGAATSVFPGLQITGNRIGNPTAGDADQVYTIGITAQGSADGVISNNAVWIEGYVVTALQGINVGVNSATGTFTIERNTVNRVRNNNGTVYGAYGINLGGGINHVVQNNFVSGVINNQTAGTPGFGTTFGAYGIRSGGGTGHKIYHNSVNLYGAIPGAISTNLTAAFLISTTAQTGLDVRNNIFANQITGGNPTGTRNAAIFLPSAGTATMNLTLNNNAYYAGTDVNNRLAQVGVTFGTGEYLVSNFDPTATTPATNFRAYTSTLSAAGTNDNASFASSSPPPFTSNVDLHIPAGARTRLESGGAAVGVVTDIDLEMRNAATPDIGADEFAGQPPFANDIAAVAFVTPTNGATLAVGQTFTPQASFTNNGTATQTNVTVRYRILNASNTVIYNQTVTIPSIAPLQTVVVSFPSTSLPSGGTYTIQASAELAGDQDATNDSISGTVNAVQPINGTINVGAGETYTSLTNAGGLFQALNTSGISGNIVINITSDLTAETGAVVLNQLAEAGAGGYTVTIKPSGAARTISGTSAASSALIILNGADRIIFDGSLSGGTDRSLTITNSQATTGVVIWMRSPSATNGATNNVVKNCIINGAPGPNSTTVAGILTGSGTTLGGAAESPNSNNTVQNNYIYRVQNSLFLSGGATVTTLDQNWVIAGNEFGSSVTSDKNIFRGMLISGSQNFMIAGNFVHGIQSTGATTAAMSGIQLAGLLNGGLVANNTVTDIKNISTSGTGAFGLQVSATSTASGVTIANNFITDVAAIGSATVNSNGFGITFNGSGTGYNVYFNSVNMNTNQTTATLSAALNVTTTFATAGALNVRNNIFANTQTTGTRYAVYSTAAASVFAAIDYNDYFAQNVGFIGGNPRPTLADWQAATGQDANSKAVDPLFVSATNLHLQAGSPLIDAAVAGTGITTDIDGETRGALPDIGADEVSAPAQPGTLQFGATTYTVGEAGGTVTLTVTRTGGTDGAVAVNYTLTDGSATGGTACGGTVDYVNTGGTINFVAGQASQTITVAICNDTILESAETFTAMLSGATGGAVIGAQATTTVTINDDEVALGTFSISDVRVNEGNGGTTTATFTVTLSGGGSQAASVVYSTANNTAMAGSDYTAIPATTLTFAPGQTTQTVTVAVNGDLLKEANETFFVNLSSPSGATIADPQGRGIIVDNDRAYLGDFDRDLRTDLSVFRPDNGFWYIFRSSGAAPQSRQFGQNGDIPTPGDYDADGIADLAVFRPSNGTWYIQLSSTSTVVQRQWGISTDKPVQGDYDGDDRTDIAVFRDGIWYVIPSSTNAPYGFQFGTTGDQPVQGDYDGDHTTDYAVYRSGTWFAFQSSTGTAIARTFGAATDKPIVGDFDGDGKSDFTVYRPSAGVWYILDNETNANRGVAFGDAADIPVAGDYDGDGTTDIAVFRPSNGFWYTLNSGSAGGFTSRQFGQNGDIPIPARYQPQQ